MVQQISKNNYVKCVTYCIFAVGGFIIWYSMILEDLNYKPLRKLLHQNETTRGVDRDYKSDVEYIRRMIYGQKKHMNRSHIKRTAVTASITSMSNISETISPNDNIKHVLIWNPDNPPFDEFNFDENIECKYKNCYFTSDISYFDDERLFDAVLFSALPLHASEAIPFHGPLNRSRLQKYIFVSRDSAEWVPITNPLLNSFFNWTWTYRLDSDILWRNYLVEDLFRDTIGPNKDIQWRNDYEPITDYLLRILRSKNKAGVSVLSHCHSKSRREIYFRFLDVVLGAYNLTIDFYGNCSRLQCERTECANKISNKYYFYLAFEDAFDDSYVTDHVLTAFQRYAIPVVLGGANYSRFLPPGSYIDALTLSPLELAKTMHDLITNFTLYQEYFRWTTRYRLKTSYPSEMCNLCKALNNNTLVKKETVYEDFEKWWMKPVSDLRSTERISSFVLKILTEAKNFRMSKSVP